MHRAESMASESRKSVPPSDAHIVAYFRVDPGPRITRSLVGSAAVMTCGSLTMAGSFARLAHAGHDLGDPSLLKLGFALGAAGLALVIAGGLIAIVGLRRVLAEDRYLALRTDGVYFQDGARGSLLPWEDVEAIGVDDRALVFERHDGGRWIRPERLAGIEPEALAVRAREVRRKALFGLL